MELIDGFLIYKDSYKKYGCTELPFAPIYKNFDELFHLYCELVLENGKTILVEKKEEEKDPVILAYYATLLAVSSGHKSD